MVGFILDFSICLTVNQTFSTVSADELQFYLQFPA